MVQFFIGANWPKYAGIYHCRPVAGPLPRVAAARRNPTRNRKKRENQVVSLAVNPAIQNRVTIRG